MKKFFYLLPAVALLFAACSDDDDKNNNGFGKGNKLEVKASEITKAPSNTDIDAVKLTTYTNTEVVLAISTWDNGFTIVFPETVASTNLIGVSNLIDSEPAVANSINISDKDAKICYASLVGYKGDEEKSNFYFAKKTSTTVSYETYEVEYVYSDRKVTIKGEGVDKYEDEFKYDVTLNKGWNRVVSYWKETEGKDEDDDKYYYEYVSNIPSGLSWYYGYYDED